MDWIEVTAKTVEEAKELALDRLGVVEDELEFEVVDEPRAGPEGHPRPGAGRRPIPHIRRGRAAISSQPGGSARNGLTAHFAHLSVKARYG